MPKYISGQQQSGDILSEGDYKFTVERALLKTSSNGNPMIELWLRLPHGALAIDNLVFTEKAWWKIDQFRTSIGEIVLPDEDVDVNPSDLIGKTGVAHVTIESYQGKERNKIGSYLEPDGLV